MRTILLGPQRFKLNATAALRSLAVDGPVATINAGWEEREDAVGELDHALDGRARHLRLFHRFNDVLAKDERFARAALIFRDRHDDLAALYRLRLEHALDGVYAVQRRVLTGKAVSASSTGVAFDALLDAIEGVRRVDAWYLDRLQKLYHWLRDTVGFETNEVIAWHRAELAALLSQCVALVMPGGNIVSLLRVLRMFSLEVPASMPVIAWSAGAMALTDRVVLFHDHGPDGARESEVYAAGLGRLPGIVAFPHAKSRLQLDDPERCAVLARRFTDARCLLLDDGSWVEIGADGQLPDEARFLGADGRVHTGVQVSR